MSKSILCIFSLCVLASCMPLTKPPITVVEKPVILHPGKPDPIRTRDIDWEVWNKARLLAKIDELGAECRITDEYTSNGDFSVFVLSPDDYGDLGVNMQEILRYIKEQNLIIDYYRKTIDDVSTQDSEESSSE